MRNVRQPAVAGTFYPDSRVELENTIRDLLDAARIHQGVDAPPPKAVIAPHAGYRYSGPIAASAYVHLEIAPEQVERVILLGPAHRFALRGLATPKVFNSPRRLCCNAVMAWISGETVERPARRGNARVLMESLTDRPTDPARWL